MVAQTHEPNKLLALGEKLRENPDTILLSIPVLSFGLILFSLTGDKEALAGAYGHLGLAFRLYHKHHWQNPVLLKIAYWLLSRSALINTGMGQPTVRMVMGGIASDLGNYDEAKKEYELGIKMAKDLKDNLQAAFITGHLGRLEIKTGDLPTAKKTLNSSLKVLSAAVKKDSSPRLHIWLSNVEIGLSEWFLAAGDKTQAKIWADKVTARAEKYDLKTRKLDAAKLLEKITASAVVVFPFIRNFLFHHSLALPPAPII